MRDMTFIERAVDSAADIAHHFATKKRRRDGELPIDFPNDEDLLIAQYEYEISGSMLDSLRAVREWRKER